VRPAPALRSAPLPAALAAVALASLAGCAFSNVEIHPTEQPDLPFAPNAGRGREVVVVVPFEEKRYSLERCGMQKNGYNADTADAVCTVSPSRWLADALREALIKSGYRVLAPDVVPGPTTVILRGELRQYFVEPKLNFWTATIEADVGVTLEASSPSGLLAKRHFYVKGKDTTMASTEVHFQAAADAAAGEIVGKMVVSVTELLNRYPGLGAPSATVRVAGAAR
jgi:hypothetical protein